MLWEVPSGRCLRTFEPDNYVNSVCLSANGRLAISNNWGDEGRLLDVSTGRCLGRFAWNEFEANAPVSAVSLSCDSQWLLLGRGHLGAERVGGQAYEVELWEVASGRSVRIFYHDDDVTSVLFSADDRFALSGSYDWTLRLWELATGRCLRLFEGHDGHVNSVCLSKDSRLALSGSDDGTLKLWEVASGRCVRTFEGHKSDVSSVALSLDGRFAASGSSDRTVRLWEVATGRCIHTLEAHRDAVNSVSLCADGRWAISGGEDGALMLWALDWELEERVAADWDEAARAHLVNFLTLHTPCAAQLTPGCEASEEEVALALTRKGQPNWSEEDFKQLLDTLGFAGYGFLRPDSVRRELEKMSAAWQGPPPLSGAEEMA
jgi:WD40 repeat protein